MTRWLLLSGNDRDDLIVVTNHWRLDRLISYVDARLEEPLSLTTAAGICGLEKTYFCRFFQVHMGISFSQWNRRLRIQRAKNLLENEHRGVAQVAMAVGYKDVRTFERHFRQCENVSPIQYRRRRETPA